MLHAARLLVFTATSYWSAGWRRRNIVKARAFIADRGYAPTADVVFVSVSEIFTKRSPV